MLDNLLEAFRQLGDQIVAATPRVIVGIMLVLLALVVAKVVEKALRAILERLQFDRLIERAGIDRALQRLGIRQQLNQFIPRLVYFLLLVLLAKTVADALELEAISGALAAFFGYLPNLIAALLLLVIGSAAAQFAGKTVAQAADESGIEFSASLGRMVSAVILFMVGLMALAQLRVDTEIVRIVTSFLLAGLAVAFGLSFGLGTRDLTRNILAGFYARRHLKIGQPLEIGGQRGVLEAITPTHTVLSVDERTISISNGRFLDEVTRQ